MEDTGKNEEKYSVEVSKEEDLANCTGVYRCAHFPDHLMDNMEQPVDSIYQAFEVVCASHGAKDCIGWQELGPDGKPCYKWMSYAQFLEQAEKAARVLAKHGIGLGAHRHVTIVATISREWLTVDMGLMRL